MITLDGRGHHLLQWYGFAAFIFKCWIGHSKLSPSFLYASCFRSLMVECDIVFGTVFGFNFGSTFWGRFISLEIAQTHFWVQFWDLKMGPWKVWCGCRVSGVEVLAKSLYVHWKAIKSCKGLALSWQVAAVVSVKKSDIGWGSLWSL